MRKILATIACLSMAACTGALEPDDGPGDPGTPGTPGAGNAKAQFESSVLPIVRKCSGAACHSGTGTFPPKFLGAGDESGFYDALVADTATNGNFRPENARVLGKLEAGAHQGLTYSQAEVEAISLWLQAEFDARFGGGVTPGGDDPAPPAPVNLLAQWAGCMTQQNFDTAQMGTWADKGSSEGRCGTCHADGLARMFINNDDTKMFLANRYEVFIYGFFTTAVDPATGQAQVVPATDKLVLMGSGEAGNLHPTFNVSPDDRYFQRLNQFTDLTRAAVAAGQCGPAEFPTEPLPQ